MSGTYFYARYVDDIILVTAGNEDPIKFAQNMKDQLPSSLGFHPIKSKPYELGAFQKNAPEDIKEIDFLGYKLSVGQIVRNNSNQLERAVSIDISDIKADRIKFRIVKSICEFNHTDDIEDFIDRIRILSGNYNLFSMREGRSVNVGLYCNYRLIDVEQSKNLREIDRFYRGWILGHCGPVSARFRSRITEGQKTALLRYSFVNSYQKRSFYHFSQDRLVELKKCWKYA